MLQNAGNVYNIARENKPMPRSTITNVIYEAINYRYTCYSMGEGTSFMPERHRFIGLIIVDEGELTVEAKDGDDWHHISVAKGQVFLRPAYQLIGFRAVTDCVFVEFDFPIGCEMSEELYPEAPFNVKDLIAVNKEAGENRRTVLEGDEFEFDVIAFPAGYVRPQKTWATGMVHVYDGELDVFRDGKHLALKDGDNMFSRIEDEVEVKAVKDTILATFYRKRNVMG